MPIAVRGRGRGLRMQAGAGHPFSTHIALNCNFGTRLGLQESKCIEKSTTRVTMLIGVRGCGRGVENAAGSRATFQHPCCFEM